MGRGACRSDRVVLAAEVRSRVERRRVHEQRPEGVDQCGGLAARPRGTPFANRAVHEPTAPASGACSELLPTSVCAVRRRCRCLIVDHLTCRRNKILDHNTNPSTRPTIQYQPYVSGTTGISASSAKATFSPSNQSINLSATLTTTAGVAINEGTVTFTILNGTQVIG